MAAFGIVCALYERERSGQGQYVDAAMIDGAASLMTMHFGFHNAGMPVGRGKGMLDTGAPFYEVYETKDGKYVGVGAIEPQFFAAFWAGLGLDGEVVQMDRSGWPDTKKMIAARFLEKTRAEWEEIYEGTDACVSPVLDLSEAPAHPHNVARGLFQDLMGNQVPGPAPRLQRTPAQFQVPPPNGGQHTDEILSSYGYTPEEIKGLRAAGTAG